MIKNTQLPLIKEHMSKEDFAELEHAIDTNKTGLDHIDKHVYLKMYGFKDIPEYYEAVSLDLVIKDVKVPTIALSSHDDIIVGYQFVPLQEIQSEGCNVFHVSTLKGGHACHMTGNLKPETWY